MIEKTINIFLPTGLSGKAQQQSARKAIVITLAILIWAPVFGPCYYLLGSPSGGIIIGVAAVALLLAMMSLRLTRSVFLTGHLVAVVIFMMLMMLSTLTLGAGSPSLWWLPAVPILALVISGVPSGAVWAGLCSLACLVFLLNDYVEIVSLSNEITGSNLRILHSLATIGITLCAFSMTVAFKWSEDAAHKELERARLESEAANQAKSQFLANMSHEIRTPMNAILGMTELVLKSELEKKQRDYLETVAESAEALLSIINEILDFSKVEAGKIELELIPFNIRHDVAEIERGLAIRADNKHLDFNWKVDEDVPEVVVGDPKRLRQILVNLCANAIKFTERGDVTVKVVNESVQQNQVNLRFEVSDSGIGIPPDKLDAIFTAFEQADTSTTRRFGGTGLGLSISSRLVRLMGGQIDVQSELGSGSLFQFTIGLEIAKSEHVVSKNESDGNTNVASIGKPNMGLRILVAEDGLTNQVLANALLENLGHQVTIAENGRRAVELWDEQPFDLILMDIQMPEMDGIEASGEIRKREQLKGGHIPIIALTAHALTGDRSRCLDAGMDSYLSKPIRSAELESELERFMNQEA